MSRSRQRFPIVGLQRSAKLVKRLAHKRLRRIGREALQRDRPAPTALREVWNIWNSPKDDHSWLAVTARDAESRRALRR